MMKAASICDPCDRRYDKYTVFNSLYRFVVKINQVCESFWNMINIQKMLFMWFPH